MRDGVLVSEVRVAGRWMGTRRVRRVLVALGYTPGSVRLQMHLVAQLSRWLMLRAVGCRADGVDGGAVCWGSAGAGAALFRSRRRLSRRRLSPRPGCRASGRADRAVGRGGVAGGYRRYLLVERVLTVESARVYVTAIRPFVESFVVGDRLELDRMTAADVSAFVLARRSAVRGRRSVRSRRRCGRCWGSCT